MTARERLVMLGELVVFVAVMLLVVAALSLVDVRV
jgi:hypothetical protein